ncbi:isocitrate/isopropylmalate dehydrogenase family protein [Terracoccus luteus]|uniref:isocitrate/isopropylmalate dehydrogenase family protein n=1 Tax=Terracoccus luteus TaxID=53356 RepID=UPI000EAD2572|nr:isocitrate/isopropylmalate family dehydrogenase [Terracoccus luteus]
MRLLVLPGDGIGPEITDATLRVLDTVDRRFGLGLEIDCHEIGFASLATDGTTLPDSVLDAVAAADGTVLGPVSHYDYPPAAQGGVNPSAALRTRFRLHSNIRPARSVEGLTVLRAPLDVVIVRENTEGFYADRNMHAGTGEFMTDADTALAVRKVTATACRAVAEQAFRLAETRRRHVTAVHKANVLKLSDGLFLREVRAVAAEHPDVELRELIVDAAAARLIRDPQLFDVLVTTNMFGDILSDEATELAGSLGIGGSISVDAADRVCVAQAQHGSAPDIAGQGVANPVSLIASVAMLLRWWGGKDRSRVAFVEAADAVDAAVALLVAAPETRTRDLGGPLGTTAFTDALVARLDDGTELVETNTAQEARS